MLKLVAALTLVGGLMLAQEVDAKNFPFSCGGTLYRGNGANLTIENKVWTGSCKVPNNTAAIVCNNTSNNSTCNYEDQFTAPNSFGTNAVSGDILVVLQTLCCT